MKVDRIIELGNGHKIEFGTSTWNDNTLSVRNRYPTSTGGFSPRSSSEIPIEDIPIIITSTIENGYLEKEDIIRIMEVALEELKK
ncbi:hypothetical protein KORDIASMS9_02822 [Kordia sp. SMS9]|uniref:hypothetical protein n=1 Tax=Kordia sp. SMS9 TaxID=2282170 RepID=UPI000E0DF319|nr:hypothetical protein [Kordia sp. SMS9]AXG70582.1 hypothetical protein KORDIASMS9_02822 [Kordia sp. SMS9]